MLKYEMVNLNYKNRFIFILFSFFFGQTLFFFEIICLDDPEYLVLILKIGRTRKTEFIPIVFVKW